MKSALIIKSALAVLFVLWPGPKAYAQDPVTDICLLKHVNVTDLSGGVVVAASKKENERPLAGAVVELRVIGEQDVVARATTNANGHFEFPNLTPGSYSLAAKPPQDQRPALFITVVEVRLQKAKPGKQAQEVLIALGSEFSGCHGGYAQLRKVKSGP